MSKEREERRFKVFLACAYLHSVMATCPRFHTACVISKEKRIRGVGYNGSVSGDPHCEDEGCLMIDGHCKRTRHGEKNAITNTERAQLRGAEAIIIGTPCFDCMKDLIHEKVKKIYYVGSYENAEGKEFILDLAKRRKVVLEQMAESPEELFQFLFDNMTRTGGVLYRAGYGLKIIKTELPKNGGKE